MMWTLHRTFPAFDVLKPQDVERIRACTLDLLANDGIVIRCSDARASMEAAGAKSTDEIVRIGPELLATALASVPKRFRLAGRNVASVVEIGGSEVVSAPIYGATHIIDDEGVRRRATLSDVHRLHNVVQRADCLQNVGSNIVEPSDVPQETRHLHILRSLVTNTDKSFMAVTTSRDPSVAGLNLAHVRAEDSVEIARLAFGPGFDDTPCMIGVATCNSALTWEKPSLGVIRTLALAGQAIMIAPFSIAGSNTSMDPAALLVQVNAEVLAGIVYAQIVRPGTPVLYGPYATTLDRETNSSMAGTPEICLYLLAFGQLARRYGIPYRGGGLLTGSKSCDYQAGVEGSAGLYSSLLAGAHFLFHAAGWLEGGLTVDPVKLVLDLEELRKMVRLQQGLDVRHLDTASVRLRS